MTEAGAGACVRANQSRLRPQTNGGRGREVGRVKQRWKQGWEPTIQTPARSTPMAQESPIRRDFLKFSLHPNSTNWRPHFQLVGLWGTITIQTIAWLIPRSSSPFPALPQATFLEQSLGLDLARQKEDEMMFSTARYFTCSRNFFMFYIRCLRPSLTCFYFIFPNHPCFRKILTVAKTIAYSSRTDSRPHCCRQNHTTHWTWRDRAGADPDPAFPCSGVCGMERCPTATKREK